LSEAAQISIFIELDFKQYGTLDKHGQLRLQLRIDGP